MATFTVTNLFDSGSGSLRDFISTANSSQGADTIDFDSMLSGAINLTGGELGISDDLTINGLGADQLTLDAGGNSRVFNVNDGNYDSDLEVGIEGLTITGGNALDNSFPIGGGIFNWETLTVSNSTISGNTASGGGGGISSNGGTLTVNNSTISGNIASSDGGGGIDIIGADLTVSNSTISGNTATFGGGGIRTSGGGTLTVNNSTISGNTAGDGGGISGDSMTVNNSTISGNIAEQGGGISSSFGDVIVSNSTISSNSASGGYGGGISSTRAYLTVTNSTISGNSATFDGGGINSSGVTVSNSTISGNTASRYGGGISNGGNATVTNSTISGNTAKDGSGFYNSSFSNEEGSATVTSSIIAANTGNKDIDGNDPFTSGGNNLIGNGNGAEGFTNGVKGDLVSTAANPIDPQLGPLQNNGGLTLTQALMPGSSAIDTGSNPLNLEFDQRGSGFDRVIGVQADIGAVEVVPEPDSTLGLLGVAILGAVLLRKRQGTRVQSVEHKVATGIPIPQDPSGFVELQSLD